MRRDWERQKRLFEQELIAEEVFTQATYDLELGRLDPPGTVAGAQQRLRNLGLFAEEADGEWTPETVEALRDFQSMCDLEPSGELDASTIDALVDRNGS